jgi:6-phosphogluconolactonase
MNKGDFNDKRSSARGLPGYPGFVFLVFLLSAKFSQELRMLKKASAVFVVIVAIAAWMACGKNQTHFVYAAVPGPSELAVYREDPNSGVLTALTGSPFTVGQSPQSVSVHPSGKFLYVANAGQSTISLFTLSSTGVPTEVTPRAQTGTTPLFLVMDPTGKFLFAANAFSNNIYMYSIDSGSGALTLIGNPASVGLSPLNMKLSPSGNVLYVTSAESTTNGVIQAYSVDPTAQAPNSPLNPLPASPFLTGPNPDGLTITPDGKFLYTVDSSINSISEFSLDSTGSLTELPSSPFGQSSTFSNPVSALIDPSGKYMFVSNEGSNSVAAYTVGSDGGLTAVSTPSFNTGSQPNFLVMSSEGKYLLVGLQSGSIQVFVLDSSTGILTAESTYSIGSTPASIAITQ